VRELEREPDPTYAAEAEEHAPPRVKSIPFDAEPTICPDCGVEFRELFCPTCAREKDLGDPNYSSWAPTIARKPRDKQTRQADNGEQLFGDDALEYYHAKVKVCERCGSDHRELICECCAIARSPVPPHPGRKRGRS
jgi:hypothetical protein